MTTTTTESFTLYLEGLFNYRVFTPNGDGTVTLATKIWDIDTDTVTDETEILTTDEARDFWRFLVNTHPEALTDEVEPAEEVEEEAKPASDCDDSWPLPDAESRLDGSWLD